MFSSRFLVAKGQSIDFDRPSRTSSSGSSILSCVTVAISQHEHEHKIRSEEQNKLGREKKKQRKTTSNELQQPHQTSTQAASDPSPGPDT